MITVLVGLELQMQLFMVKIKRSDMCGSILQSLVSMSFLASLVLCPMLQHHTVNNQHCRDLLQDTNLVTETNSQQQLKQQCPERSAVLSKLTGWEKRLHLQELLSLPAVLQRITTCLTQ